MKTSCNYVLEMSWKTKKTLHCRPQDVFSKSSPRRMFDGIFVLKDLRKTFLKEPQK